MSLCVYARMKDDNLEIHSKNKNFCVVKIPSKTKKEGIPCNFNNVWQMNETNDTIFNELNKNSNKLSENFWVAFGYTGSGKSYTIMGMLERLLNSYIDNGYPASISGYQIYDEKVFDIFNENIQLKCWKTNELKIDGLAVKDVLNVKNVMTHIENNRVRARTVMNSLSSRSHAIIIVNCGFIRHTFVDMAGQENGRTAQYSDNDKLKKEGTDINLNMLALKDCIIRLNKKQKHIPFRRCLLTMALKSMFYRKCNISFICTLSKKNNLFYMYDSIKYATALYKKQNNDKKNEEYSKAMDDYTKYMTDIKYIEAQETLLWKEIKFGKCEKFPKIIKMLDSKIKGILQFREKAVKYTEKFPNI